MSNNSYEIIFQEAKLENYEIVYFPSPSPNYTITKQVRLDRLPNHLREPEDDDDDDPNIIRRPNSYYHFIRPFDEEIAEYPDDITVFGPIEKGKYFDVLSMLCHNGRDFLVRNNGDRVLVESLRGKYLLIWCYFVPIPTESSAAKTCLDIIAAYSQLCVERPDEFEMVMVAKMRPNWVDDESAFDHFFSAFSCFTIPFWDSPSRDIVCKSVGLDSSWLGTHSLIIDPEQKVLQHLFHKFFRDYGACAFPFTDERLKVLGQEEFQMMLRVHSLHHMHRDTQRTIPSLGELLCLNPSHTLKKSNDDNEIITVLDLSKKLVGLYFCDDGNFVSTLNFFQKTCEAKGLEFEIVLVYLPFRGDMKWFRNHVNLALEEQNISWWILPFNDTVSRRLCRFLCESTEDVVMILGPNSTFAEPAGRKVMCHYGIEAYPFTRESIIDRRLAKLRAITLESVLTVSDELNYVVTKDGVQIPVAMLHGRNVFIYLRYYSTPREENFYDKVVYWYPELKAKDPNFEIVFVDLSVDAMNERFEVVFPLQTLNPEDVIQKVFFEGEFLFEGDASPSLIAFGKDGRILSRCAQYYLDAFLFQERLRDELSCFSFD